MISKLKDFVTDATQSAGEQMRKLREEPVRIARDAATESARRIQSLKTPVRTFARSGVELTAISHGTAQRLIQLQEKIVTSALTDAAAQLERAARTAGVGDLVRNQGDVLKAARERIVADMNEAVSIFRAAGGDVRKVATRAYAKVTGQEKAAPAGTKKPAARTPKRRAAARARKTRG